MNKTFQQLVDREMYKVRSGNRCIRSWHEAYGLMCEEVEEFWDEVKKKSNARDRQNALVELVQIATICERAAVDLALIDDLEHELEDKRIDMTEWKPVGV